MFAITRCPLYSMYTTEKFHCIFRLHYFYIRKTLKKNEALVGKKIRTKKEHFEAEKLKTKNQNRDDLHFF